MKNQKHKHREFQTLKRRVHKVIYKSGNKGSDIYWVCRQIYQASERLILKALEELKYEGLIIEAGRNEKRFWAYYPPHS